MKGLIVALIRFYQRFISPLTPPVCRFTPSCSQYTLEAVQIHGAVYGSWLGTKRILRCQPMFPGGFDPVPGSPAAGPTGGPSLSASPDGGSPGPSQNLRVVSGPALSLRVVPGCGCGEAHDASAISLPFPHRHVR